VYGYVGDSSVQGIGWVRAICIVAIALFTFVIVDLVKVLTIRLWNKKPASKELSRAKKFNEEHDLRWDQVVQHQRAY
jgi:H+-transporting ATPase